MEDWGEQLVGKSQTVIVQLDLNTGKAVVFARKGCDVEKDNPNVQKVWSLMHYGYLSTRTLHSILIE